MPEMLEDREPATFSRIVALILALASIAMLALQGASVEMSGVRAERSRRSGAHGKQFAGRRCLPWGDTYNCPPICTVERQQ